MDGGWKLNNCALDFLLFYWEGLHLVEKGNLKVGKSVLKANKFNSNANPYKNAVWFNLNKCDFPPLPYPATRCKTIHSPIKYVGHVCKPIRCVFKSSAQGYEPFHLIVLPVCSVLVSISHSSLFSSVVTPAPYVSPVRIPTATFPSHIAKTSYTNA